MSNKKKASPSSTVFYDDRCALCNRAVAFSSKKSLTYCQYKPLSSSEGEMLQKIYTKMHPSAKETMLLKVNGKLLGESDAVLHVVRNMCAPYKYLSVFSFLPRSLRNYIYRFIAKHRKWL